MLKIKLSKQEYKAVFDVLRHTPAHGLRPTLAHKAKLEILKKLYVRMQSKLLQEQKNYTLSLSLPEAWAFYEEMPRVMQMFGVYEQNCMQTIINFIHQKNI